MNNPDGGMLFIALKIIRAGNGIPETPLHIRPVGIESDRPFSHQYQPLE